MHRLSWFTGALVSGIVVTMAEWAKSTVSSSPATSHGDRLGGNEAIMAGMDQFVANVATDAWIDGRLAATDTPKRRRHLVAEVRMATGWPYIDTGRDMKTAHAGRKITNAGFHALVEDLVGPFDTFNVPKGEQKELVALLGPMRKEIVEVP